MDLQYPNLFQPIQVGKARLKNRIAMAPMGVNAMSDPSGLPTQRYVDYFAERAKGGAGLLMTGMFKVEEKIEYAIRKRGPIRADFVRPVADLMETIHPLGTKMFFQLSAGFGAQAFGNPAPVAPSAIPSFGNPKLLCRELTHEDIAELVNCFGSAAEILARAGVDGIELHGHGGFLLDQFSGGFWNKRTDRYGGDLRSRLTFAFEILSEIKKRLGGDYPVGYRFGLKHYMKSMHKSALPGENYIEVGRDIDEGLEMARLLEAEGFDALAVDAGTLAGHYWAHPPIYQEHGCMLDLSAMVKKEVKIPILAVGRLDVPDLAERAVAQGEADIITIGKGLLADPYWPDKVRQNQIEEIRPCIGCHQACTESFNGREVNSCTVNPASGRERSYQIQPALASKKVLVAGGGVAGMETARVAALRGHSVVLFEKDMTLGGHLRDASVPGDKKDIERLNRWFQRQLRNLAVDIRLGTEVSADTVSAENPDIVVVSSGSADVVPKLPGVDLPHVATTTEILLGTKPAGNNVVVVGAGENGCEVALWLTRDGKKVTLVERLDQPISLPVARANKNMLLDMLAFHQIEILTRTSLSEIRTDAVVVSERDGSTREIACDTVVLAVGMRAVNGLYQDLITSFPGPVYAIGDSEGPKNIMKAVWDGFEVARAI